MGSSTCSPKQGLCMCVCMFVYMHIFVCLCWWNKVNSEVLVTGNQVGLVLDAGIEEELRIRHLQVAEAARASLGLPVVEYVVTDMPLEVLLSLF